jgi:uncharacterized protein (DUF1697 family)
MPRYVALFRGINVGKAKRIAMADLRALLGKLGYTDVATLLNSGNALFTGPASKKHAAQIRAAVATKLGVDAHVIVKSAREIADIVTGNALEKVATDPSRLLVAMCDDGKALAALSPLSAGDWGREKLHLGKQAAYLWCADGILESKLAERLLKDLKGTGTTRNWGTLLKIHAMLTDGS